MGYNRPMNKLTAWIGAALLALIVGGTAFTVSAPQTAYAAGDPCQKASILGFAPWYRGLTDSATCTIKSPANNLSGFIWTVVLNLLDDLLRAVGLASVGYIIWGGFRYMTSEGSSAGMARAKSQILNAIIGLVISVLSVAIINLAVGAFQ